MKSHAGSQNQETGEKRQFKICLRHPMHTKSKGSDAGTTLETKLHSLNKAHLVSTTCVPDIVTKAKQGPDQFKLCAGPY